MASIKLQGSTIIEALVAMTIVLTCLAITMLIFSNLSRDVNDEIRIEAEIRMNTIAAETIQKKDFTEKEFMFDNMLIKRTIQNSSYKTRVKTLFLEAFTPFEKRIADYKELVIFEKANEKP